MELACFGLRMDTLNGKTIVVTGVASGIGAETARYLCKCGARVIGVDRHAADAELDRFVQADLSASRAIGHAVAEIGSGIDGLCNIAGLPPTAPAVDVLAVNALGLMTLTERLLPQLNDGAAIVNMSSLAGAGWPQAAAAACDFIDNATFDNLQGMVEKHGAEGARSYFFCKEIVCVWTLRNRWTWRDRGIRMNSICPGPVDTPILADFIATLGERAEEHMSIMDRPGRPDDIAPVVAFLCSDESAWLRGVNLPVDGGLYANLMDRMHALS